jgi:glycosyltransferase involved in cell wall biosynthesis
LSARKRLANRVEVSILPNHQRVKTYIDETRAEAPVICVWNCPAIEDVSPPQPPLGNNDIWILYHGSIVPSRLPATVLRALALLPNQVKLRVVGYETVGHLGYVCSLQQLAHELGVDARVQFLGAVPMREQLLELCHQSHIGIAFMPKNSHDMNEQNMVGASNKPFDYMSCGLALLVSDLPDWQEMYVEPGYGLSCDSNDPVSIANAVRMFIDDPDLMRSMGEKGRQKILSHWNYARQFLPVFTRLNENRK